jgi:hypothetical protein
MPNIQFTIFFKQMNINFSSPVFILTFNSRKKVHLNSQNLVQMNLTNGTGPFLLQLAILIKLN